jgi:hypothetical protein
VDSITTRVTPRPYSQSASSSSDLVVVAKLRTSWRRRPGLVSCGTRTHATSVALPISSAATCSTSSAGSSVTSSTAIVLSVLTGFRKRAARRSQQGHNEAESRAQRQQCRTPGSGSRRQTLLRAQSTMPDRRRRATRPKFSRLQGVTAGTPTTLLHLATTQTGVLHQSP